MNIRDNWFDTMQVCNNGHKITEYLVSYPNYGQPFCSTCGAKTIAECPACNRPIPGHHHIPGILALDKKAVPKYCIGCGAPYPWQGAAIENLSEVLRHHGVTEQDLQKVNAALPDIVHDTPKTESASLKLMSVLKTLGKSAYDISIKVVTDVASETAKKTMGLS